MAKKTKVPRDWTATEIHKLKGLAKKKLGVDKIARSLKRTVAATAVKASALGVSLDYQSLTAHSSLQPVGSPTAFVTRPRWPTPVGFSETYTTLAR